ncbi:peroxidase 10 [Phtheirospermum japonicum]|uniref:Peroxidase n=1 Tax=Phtheirospermum japonicum TaxID=374723 RepID=A0A830BMH0_9LAMI|nr:peroxidase 10 [Phtheirospermum japonicum]
MYSKKSNIYAFFFIILYFTPLISTFSDGPLSYGYNYYDKSCPSLETIIWRGVWNATLTDKRMRASLLRLHFHDCFVNGCDGSVLLDDTKSFKGEQTAGPNLNSIRGLEVIDRIKEDVERCCPNTVSCADILALAAKVAVVQSGGPYYRIKLGRLDGLTANFNGANKELPSPVEPIQNITAKFVAKGLNIKDVVVLSGAHSIGFAQCSTIKSRLYNFSGSGKSDTSMNPLLLSRLQVLCPNKHSSDRQIAPLDWQSIDTLDNKYYNNIMNKAAVLQSDQALWSNQTTAQMVKVYSGNPLLFLTDFAQSMKKLGNIGVITVKGEGKGEIRKICGAPNKAK